MAVAALLLVVALLALRVHHEHIAIVPNSTPAKGSAQVPVSAGHTFMLRMKDGSLLPVRDFLKNADVIADTRNPGVYYLGNVMSENPHDTAPRYIISYEHSIQFFKIVLLQDPLGDVRRDAETYLKQTLDISDADLCNLNYVVVTPASVSQVFSSLDLKWSMCGDSVTLR